MAEKTAGAHGLVDSNLHVAVLFAATILCLFLSRHLGGPNIAVVMAIVLIAVLSSIGGFAFSAICGAMLFHLDLVPVQAVEIMMLCSIANRASRVWALRRAID